MSDARSGPTPRGVASRSNIYTVLLLIAALALGIGAGFVGWKSMELFGHGNPFAILEG